MTRDRLAALRAAMKDDAQEFITLEERNEYMDNFFKQVTELSEEIDDIQSKVLEVERSYQSMLLNIHIDEKIKDNVESLVTIIKRKATIIRGKLKTMEQQVEQFIAGDAGSKSEAEKRIKKNQYSMLSIKFVETMKNYNRITVEYREKYKKQIFDQFMIRNNPVTNEELEEMLEQGDPAVFTERFLANTEQEIQQLADIRARHADIKKLEKSIQELHDLFVDMAVLVESQGEILDRIETNVAAAKNYTESGKKEINQAADYKTKAFKKKFYILICLVILLVVITLSVIYV